MGGSTTGALAPTGAGIGVLDPGSVGSARGWSRIAATGLVVFVAAINLLLPIERGVPYLRFGPISLMGPVAFNLIAFASLLFTRPIRTLRRFRHPPLFWQGILVLILFARAAFSPDVTLATATAILYSATWVAQFGLFLSILDWIGRAAFARAYCAVAGVGAGLGILEGLFGYLLPPYQLFRFLEAVSEGRLPGGTTGRTDGPPGNSILFAFIMVLTIPFAFEIRSRLLRWGLIAMILVATGLTIARVGYLMLFIVAMGGLLMGGRRARASATAIGLALSVVVVVMTVFSSSPLVERVLDRVSGKGEATENVCFRTEALRLAVGRTFDDGRIDIGVWGAGIREGDQVGQGLSVKVTTLDNVYATLFYEGGLLLLGTYLVAHGFHVRRLWAGYGPAGLYWFGAVAGLVAGVAFVSIYTVGANFSLVATLAVLGHERIVRQRIRRAVARQALAPAPAALA